MAKTEIYGRIAPFNEGDFPADRFSENQNNRSLSPTTHRHGDYTAANAKGMEGQDPPAGILNGMAKGGEGIRGLTQDEKTRNLREPTGKPRSLLFRTDHQTKGR